ncbi:aldehyde dehydrogenase family protein [Vibrio sp. S9_S30]|uniref:aldehyde dehydrogenase family protein n=1 Tax=Vibrio sp. S9_S30 TaxID=2720226 RepID=UPI00168127E8|nr:aldehyde dehydrogenase family protein [Vibrio sp. S9_S30]MBD1558158.1 aldehyde dehydrogenase family protein [Vibrio sp. S9_S30]
MTQSATSTSTSREAYASSSHWDEMADSVLNRAHWASQIYRQYSKEQVQRIVHSVADAAYEKADQYGEWAVRETGFGVAKDKTLKNQFASKHFLEHYHDHDFVTPRVCAQNKIVEIPKPAGVVFALIPSTNPIATINFKVLSVLMTRSVIVLSPHPAARECSMHAIQYLAKVAEAAGAPAGTIQVIEEPCLPLVNACMRSAKTDVILATGGTPMVRAAYSSSNPAIGVGPGNAPVFVDSSANIERAAHYIVDSKSFDNSVLCTNESVIITLQECESSLRDALSESGGYLCSPQDSQRLRQFLFHDKGFNTKAIGKSARWIASEAGICVPDGTLILVTPIECIGHEEVLSKEKLCPVIGFFVASSRRQAIAQARGQLRMTGAGHSAALHATDEALILEFAEAVDAYRVILNAPCSQGAAGFQTHLNPSFTIGTGYFGRSSIGENIGPQHLVHWTRIAYNQDACEKFGDFEHLISGLEFAPVFASKLDNAISGSQVGPLLSSPPTTPPHSASQLSPLPSMDMREQIRRIIIEELSNSLKH